MKIHFIGIGGIGVSALAKYYLEKGHQVSGSDLVSSEVTEALKKLGAKIFIGQHKTRCLTPGVKQVIYSPAVQKDNPELKVAKKIGIECQSYPQALGELTKKHFTIAVSGTHGKSTTTAMIGLLLVKAGFDPTVIVGTKLREFGDSNCRVGKSKYLVIEADEHFASFLNYWPKIIILTALEPDHLDYYKNFKNYILAFKKIISHLPKDGILIANKDDENIKNTNFFAIAKNVVYYSLKDRKAKKIRKILKIPGEHNVSNALAALAVARTLKIPDKITFKTLSKYKGAWRRFEEKPGLLKRTIVRIKNRKKREELIKFKIISDYGHHPTEIKVTLKAAREKWPRKKIWCVYQPHQYQRTYYLLKDFVKVFREAPVDKLIVTDIYDVAGREEKKIKEKVNSQKLVRAICQDLAFPTPSIIYLPKEGIIGYLQKNLKNGEVVIIMGAGDIYNLWLQLTEERQRGKIK